MIRSIPIQGWLRLVFCLGLLLPLGSMAQSANAPLYRVVEDFLRTQTQGLPGKVGVRLIPLDGRTQLAPCDAFEPFLPPGSTVWGKTTIGVRCLSPASWTVYVQAQISIQAQYIVSARTLTAGHMIGSGDVISRNGDLGALPATTLTDPGQALGKTIKFGIAAGHPVRSDQLHAPWAVQQGQSVKMVSHGSGFSVSSEGKALNNAVEGQVVQVRTPSGQTVSGIARQGGTVEITY